MKPILYTAPMCSQCEETKATLIEHDIDFTTRIVTPSRALDDRDVRRAIGKLRACGHTGKFADLLVLPILEVDDKAFNYEEISKNIVWITTRSRQAETIETPQPPEKPRKSESIDLTDKVQKTMEHLVTQKNMHDAIKSFFDSLSDESKFAFLVGTRLSNHANSERISRFAEQMKFEASTIDPWRKQDEN